MADDNLDVANCRPVRVDLAGGEFELVGGGVIRGVGVSTGETGHGVRCGLAVWEPGAVPPLAVDRGKAEPPAVLQPVKVGDPLSARTARRLPPFDLSPPADHCAPPVTGEGGKDGRTLGGARV